MYQNYIFDLYGTLVDINTNEDKPYLWEKMVEIYGFQGAVYTRQELRKTYFAYCAQEVEELKARKVVMYPEISIEKVFARLYEAKGVTASKELVTFTCQMFRIVATKYIRLYDGVTEFLEALKNAKKKIYLLSNAQYEFTIYEMNYLGITQYFDGIVISSHEDCQKPGRDIYDAIINRYHLDKKKSIMIGNDKTADIKGAYEAGLDSLYIASNLSPKEDRERKSYATYEVEDGDVYKIPNLILKGN